MSSDNTKCLLLSLGENCLVDDVLQRHGLKVFSTPYSFARSNIDYAIELEKTEYSTLLSKDNLYYAKDSRVVRSNAVKDSDNIYDSQHLNGFEFTHHDVISDSIQMESYKRKVNRMKELKYSKDILCFLYHYRYNKNMNVQKIIDKACTFLTYYNSRAFMAVLFQNIQSEHRGVIENTVADNVITFEFITPYIWQGSDKTKFFARNEDDLMTIMLDAVKIAAQQR